MISLPLYFSSRLSTWWIAEAAGRVTPRQRRRQAHGRKLPWLWQQCHSIDSHHNNIIDDLKPLGQTRQRSSLSRHALPQKGDAMSAYHPAAGRVWTCFPIRLDIYVVFCLCRACVRRGPGHRPCPACPARAPCTAPSARIGGPSSGPPCDYSASDTRLGHLNIHCTPIVTLGRLRPQHESRGRHALLTWGRPTLNTGGRKRT